MQHSYCFKLVFPDGYEQDCGDTLADGNDRAVLSPKKEEFFRSVTVRVEAGSPSNVIGTSIRGSEIMSHSAARVPRSAEAPMWAEHIARTLGASCSASWKALARAFDHRLGVIMLKECATSLSSLGHPDRRSTASLLRWVTSIKKDALDSGMQR